MTAPSVTVSVLTYNGERYLEALVIALESQVYEGDFDVLVIDSGSTDATLEILAAHPGIRVHSIENDRFGHGRTRNLVAQLATGEIVAYLTHDAVPIGNRWLAELVSPFVDDERIAAVLGKQVARSNAPPVVKYDIRRAFASLGPDYGVTVVYDTGRDLTRAEVAAAAFYSDANAAARRNILLNEVPYRDVAYAEDQLFGRDLFEAGYRRAYAPRAAVEHSNDTTLGAFGGRIEADLNGLRSIGTEIVPMGRFTAFKQFIKWSSADAALILVDRDYSAWKKLSWLVRNPWYHAVKWSSLRRASRPAVTN